MVVAIAGGHGKIGLKLARLLADAGHEVLGLIRDPRQSNDVADAGAQPVVIDLEATDVGALAASIEGADAVVFSAGAGPGSGAERKLTLDRDGAILLIEAARRIGARRYVMVSAIRADPQHQGDDVFDVYLRAKGEADAALAASGLEHTIVRPGRLTDAAGTGRVLVGTGVPHGEISRQDVAAVLAATLPEPASIGKTFEVVGGGEEIGTALAKLANH